MARICVGGHPYRGLRWVESKESRLKDERGLTAGIEAAWRGFRSRLADYLISMEDDEILCVAMVTGDEDDRDGATPYVQFCAFGDAMVHAEAVSNWYLDETYELSAEAEDRLVDLGWDQPREDDDGDVESGRENFSFEAELREADRVAALGVAALREVYGVVHPAFLDADGLELDPDAVQPTPAPEEDDGDDLPVAAFTTTPRELQALVDATLSKMLEVDAITHDDDGDIPVRAGLSVLFVRVLRDRPAVQIFGDLVVGARDLDRVADEVTILNAGHPFATFFAQDDRVCVKHLLCAAPYAPSHLRLVLDSMLTAVDDLARDVALRVKGRRVLEETADERAPEPLVETDPALVALMEVLHVKPMSAAAVAALFDHDRSAIVRALVGLRTERIPCSEHDLDVVLGHLRRGLSFLAIRAARVDQARGRGSRRPRSQQLALLPPSDTLDDGEWEHTAS